MQSVLAVCYLWGLGCAHAHENFLSVPKPSNIMGSFNAIVWNCGGLTTTDLSRSKAVFFEKENKSNFDVAFFLETHHKGEKDIPLEFLKYKNTHHIIHSISSLDEPFTGIIGLVSKQYNITNTIELIQGRILNLKIQHKTHKTKYNVSAVYLYTNNHFSKSKIKDIVAKLRRENEENHQNNIVLGDFNFIDNPKDKMGGLNQADELVCKTWFPFLAETDMIDPYREHYPSRRIWSFIGSGKARNSRIDRVYVNVENVGNMTKMKYMQTPFGGHRMLTFTLKTPDEHGKGYYKMNTSILRDRKFREIIETLFEEMNRMNTQDPILKWTTLTLAIKSKSITYSKTKNREKKRVKDKLRQQILILEENPSQLQQESEMEHYNYLTRKFRQIENTEIEGYKIRTKCFAAYEKAEPDIAFYAKLEEKKYRKT